MSFTTTPANITQIDLRVRTALARGRVAEAAENARALVHAVPDHPAGYFLMGMVAAEAGQIVNAIQLIEAAVKRAPVAEHLAQLGRLLSLQRNDEKAVAAAERALALEPADALTLDTIGCVFVRVGRHREALAPFAAAVAIDPDNLDYRYNLAAASGFVGDVDKARWNYEAIIAADPGYARAHYALATLSRQRVDANHVPRLKAALAATRTPEDALRLRYALAKELEDLADPGALAHLSVANAAQKRAIGYDFAQDAAIFDAIEALFGGLAPVAAQTGTPDAAPIFIVGMPRTGTTLADRILSSHPAVESAGELQAMPLAVKGLAATSTRMVIDPATVAASGGVDPAAIGDAYLERARHHLTGGAARFIDKLPANFLYVGHIATAFPNAAIVCLRRHPMDTIWSNYKNLFASTSAYYGYSYDPMDAARYYARFDRLMALWERLFPGRVLQLSYEALVADQAGQSRRLLAHCGLQWDDRCLSFHENAAPVATPSAAQVRRPINADAVGRWRTHEAALAPARDWLASRGYDVS